jgi:hypothetical protein
MKNNHILWALVGTEFPLFSMAQWSNDPTINTPVSTNPGEQTLSKTAICPNDNVYISYFDNSSGNYNVMLQYLDKNGFLNWPQPKMVSDFPQDSWISDYDTKADLEGNCVIIFTDIRNGDPSPVIYKTSPTGIPLWGEGGIVLSTDANAEYSPVCCVTSENNVVTAFTRITGTDPLVMVAFDENGNKLWPGEGIVLTPTGVQSYYVPALLSVSGGDFIVVFSINNGSGLYSPRYLYAMKYHIDGTPAWSDEAVVTNAGGISHWTDVYAKSDGADGVIVSWHDDRDQDMVSSAFVQHISADGEVLLGDDGMELSLAGTHQRFDPRISGIDEHGDIFLFWFDTDYDQITRGIAGQGISAAGARLWGDNGKMIIPLGTQAYGVMGADFQGGLNYVYYGMYGEDYTDVRLKATCLDRAGNYMWEGNHIFVSDVEQEVIHPFLSEYGNHQWIVSFTSTRNGNYDIYAQNVNEDGTLGVNTIGIPESLSEAFDLYPNPVSDVLIIRTRSTEFIQIFDPAGKHIFEKQVTDQETKLDVSGWEAGVYIIRLGCKQGVFVRKLVCR